MSIKLLTKILYNPVIFYLKMMNKFALEWKRVNFWSTNGFIGIFVSVIIVFLIIPLFSTGFYAHLLLQSCLTCLILSTIYSLSRERTIVIIGLILVLPFIIIDSLSIVRNSLDLLIVAYILYSLYLFIAIVVLIKRVMTASVVNTNLIFGAITIYLLVGIFWSKLYFFVLILSPNSFHGISGLDLATNSIESGYERHFDLIYFSFTTLTTLGEGDIVPFHRLAKSLTILEAMVGQLFVATVIAKSVSVWHHND